MVEPKYQANPVLARALDILFILHADHEQNCSTNAMRAVGSSQADPFLSTAAAAAALSGPLHGGANEEVLRMLDEIGSKDKVPAYIEQREGRRGQADGLRPPRLQELRSPRPHHQMGRGQGLRSHRLQSPSWKSRWNWSASPWKTSTSSSASSIPTWISTPASCTRPWASSRRCSPCCSPSRARSAGWRSGRR